MCLLEDVAWKRLKSARLNIIVFRFRIKSQQFYHGAEEFVINPARLSNPVPYSEPLMCYSGDAVRWSMVLVEILSSLRNHLGYKLYTSVDMNITPGPGMAIDTWILRKTNPSWL